MLHFFNSLHAKAMGKFDCFNTAEQFFVMTRQEGDSTGVVSVMRSSKMNYDINRERSIVRNSDESFNIDGT